LAWWIWQLSMTITEFGPGHRFILSRRPSMKWANNLALKDPSMMSTYRIPSRDRARRIE
jgi:hypothetical protein